MLKLRKITISISCLTCCSLSISTQLAYGGQFVESLTNNAKPFILKNSLRLKNSPVRGIIMENPSVSKNIYSRNMQGTRSSCLDLSRFPRLTDKMYWLSSRKLREKMSLMMGRKKSTSTSYLNTFMGGLSMYVASLVMGSVNNAIASQEHDLNSTSARSQPKIAVIGAGISGLTMGYRLNQQGYKNITVYEAKPRVGGRVHSIMVKNSHGSYSIAELGGHNITDGGDAKYLLSLVKELGLEIEDDARYLSRRFYADGEFYDSKEVLRNSGFTQEKFQKILQTLPSTACSMEDVIDHVFKEEPLLKRIFTYHVGSYEGLPTKDLSIVHNIETLKFFLPGGKGEFQEAGVEKEQFLFRYIKGGNSKLPMALAQALNGKVMLNKALQRVSKEEDKIKLEFTDSSTVLCDKLILSIPCTTYKNILWENSLILREKIDQIGQVQYGSNGKVVVPIVSDDKGSPYSSLTMDHIGTLYNNDYKLAVFFTDGVWGKSLKRNLNEYYPYMVEMLEANYGKQQNLNQIPVEASEENYKSYDGPVVKSWSEDYYVGGSYSAMSITLGEKFLEQTTIEGVPVKSMFSPINDQIFFIGEHTSLIDEIGSMESAIESAERMAKLFSNLSPNHEKAD